MSARHLQAPAPGAGGLARRLTRRQKIAGLALSLVAATLLSSAATTTSYGDQAQARIPITAAGQFDCRTEVVTGTNFAQAPVDHGSGVWTRDSALCSPSRRYLAVFQVDGNFVLYDTSTTPGTAIWATWTFAGFLGGKATRLAFQTDGNLVLYDAAGTALRHTHTSGIPTPARLVLGDDGNLVLRDQTGTVRWQSWGTQSVDCRNAGSFTCNPDNPVWGE